MSWDTTMISMLRIVINDTEAPQSYTDARLQNMIVVSARYVQQEIVFDTAYTIDTNSPSIVPDPTLTVSLDDAFTNFTILKAACLTDWSTYRAKALLAGVKARCGPAVLETLKHLEGFNVLIEQGPCKAYIMLKKEYQFGSLDNIRVVLSPFRGNNFDPSSLRSIREDRQF